MKNISLILNGVLLVAVAVLYYLHFAGTKSQSSGGSASLGDLKIAYIQSDSVLKNYAYFTAATEKLQAKGKRLEMELQGRAQTLQAEIESYQRNARNLTQGQAQAVEEDLGKKRQNLQMYQESLYQELQVDQDKGTKDLYDRITSYLSTYGKEKGLHVVFKYNAASDVIFANQALDISSEVVKGLNEQYKAELASPAKKDSTAGKK
ncbi:MAG: OmpH family outer membrane protein [Bacteroidota bacterium]